MKYILTVIGLFSFLGGCTMKGENDFTPMCYYSDTGESSEDITMCDTELQDVIWELPIRIYAPDAPVNFERAFLRFPAGMFEVVYQARLANVFMFFEYNDSLRTDAILSQTDHWLDEEGNNQAIVNFLMSSESDYYLRTCVIAHELGHVLTFSETPGEKGLMSENGCAANANSRLTDGQLEALLDRYYR